MMEKFVFKLKLLLQDGIGWVTERTMASNTHIKFWWADEVRFHYSQLITRGVTRLDGARDKNQVWRPHVRNWGLSEANVLHWRNYLWHCWDVLASTAAIWRTSSKFGAPIVTRRPGNCAPLAPPRYALACALT